MDIAHVPWGNLIAGALSGGLITKGAEWVGRRGRVQAYTMGAVDHAVQTAMQSVTGQLTRTEERLEKVEGQHEDCERNLAEVRKEAAEARAEAEKARAEAREQIAKLMGDTVPGYQPGDLRRVGGK